MNVLSFFFDPILRGPTIGSILLCTAAALVGVLVFLRKRSLLGEALSHASYPGVTGAIICAGFFSIEGSLSVLVLGGALGSALLGFWFIDLIEKKLKTSSDASLTAILSLFFGVGITIASLAQNTYSQLYRQMQAYLYGQAATMTDLHILFYSVLALAVAGFIITFFKELFTISFDAQFARTAGLGGRLLEPALFGVIVLVLVAGVRCAGVILMSAMLIAPAVAARQFTNRLAPMFALSALFGALSAFLGIYFSVAFSEHVTGHYTIPTGPMIVLVGGALAILSLLFAPKRGLVIRYLRVARFRAICVQENLLKALWRLGQSGQSIVSVKRLARRIGLPSLYLRFLLYRLIREKALEKVGVTYRLTPQGAKRGARIVRLHRLWEVYLVHSLGLKVERVHKSAEQMEHILTPEIEQKLTELLDNPTRDPHQQPIPSQEEGILYV